MSLRTKILLSVSFFMILIFALLTANILLDITIKNKLETERSVQLAASFVAKIVKMRSDNLDEINRELTNSQWVKEWLIVKLKHVQEGPDIEIVLASPGEVEIPQGSDKNILLECLYKGKTIASGQVAYMPLFVIDKIPYAARFTMHELILPAYDIDKFIKQIITIMILGILLVLLTTYILLNWLVLRPLDDLSKASEMIARGDFTANVKLVSRGDEMAQTIETFNYMAGRLDEHNKRMQGSIKVTQEELKDTRRKLVVAQRLSSTGSLAAGVAHEVNNPLSGMINLAHDLKEKNLDEKRRREYIGMIINGLNRIRQTMDKLLQLAPRASNLKQVDLSDTVSNVLALVEHKFKQKRIKLANNIDGKLPRIKVDPAEIQQVFLNILLNSIDAIEHENGEISLRSSIVDNYIKITVQDNGSGMSEEELSQCFVPFHTTKPEGKGTGLGLSIAKSIIEAHGGDIYIESQKDNGTQVHVLLPYQKEN